VTDSDDASKRELDDLARRIKMRISELRQRGELSPAHAAYLKQAQQRHDEIQKKVDVAIRDGKPLSAVKAEAARDLHGILEGFERFTEWLDKGAAKPK